MCAEGAPDVDLLIVFDGGKSSEWFVSLIGTSPYTSFLSESEDIWALVGPYNLPPLINCPMEAFLTPLNTQLSVLLADKELLGFQYDLNSPVSLIRRRIVALETPSKLRSFLISLAVVSGFLRTSRRIIESSLTVVFRGRPEPDALSVEPLSASLWTKAYTVLSD